MIDLEKMSLRELQLESARVLTLLEATNNNISQFNKQAHHNSQEWYRAVIKWYVDQHGDLPSKVGPAKNIKLLYV
jgi:hypothetical protein